MRDYALTTKKGATYYITEEQARAAADLRDQGRSIEFRDYPGEFIMPHEVEHIGPTKSRASEAAGSLAQLAEGSFDEAISLIEARTGERVPDPKRREELMAKIRMTIEAKVPEAGSDRRKREYLEAVERERRMEAADPEGYRRRKDEAIAKLTAQHPAGEALDKDVSQPT